MDLCEQSDDVFTLDKPLACSSVARPIDTTAGFWSLRDGAESCEAVVLRKHQRHEARDKHEDRELGNRLLQDVRDRTAPLSIGEGAPCLLLGNLLVFSWFQVNFTPQFLGDGSKAWGRQNRALRRKYCPSWSLIAVAVSTDWYLPQQKNWNGPRRTSGICQSFCCVAFNSTYRWEFPDMLLLDLSLLSLIMQNILLLFLSFLVIKHAWLFSQG